MPTTPLSAPHVEATAQATCRRKRERRPAVLAAQIGLAVIVVTGWELCARAQVLDEFFFSKPSDIAARVIGWFGTGSIWEHLRITLTETALALVIGSVLGLTVGFLLARVEFIAAVLEPYIKILNSLPRVVLAPIFLLWFGLGIWSKVAFGVALVFFIVFLKYLLVRSGLAPDAASVQGVGASSSAVAAMEQGRVDAAVMSDPAFSVLAQRVGAVKVLTDTRTEQGVRETFGVAIYPATVLYTTHEWLNDNGESARKLASAIVKTLRWIEQHSAQEIADAMPAEYAQGNQDVYVESIARAKQAYSTDGVLPLDGAEAVRAVLAQFIPEIRQADIDLAKTYSNDYLPAKPR